MECKHYNFVSRFTRPEGSMCLDCGKTPLTLEDMAVDLRKGFEEMAEAIKADIILKTPES